MSRLLVIAMFMALSTMPLAAVTAHAQEDDVFRDEGSGDFEMPPMPPTAAEPEAPTAKPEKATKKDKKVAGPKAKTPEPAPEAPTEPPVMAETDESHVPQPEPEAEEPAKPAKRASKAVAKSGKKAAGSFVTTREACPMLREPASEAPKLSTTGTNKKIWVEDVDQEWVRAFNKAGEAGYIKRDCVE